MLKLEPSFDKFNSFKIKNSIGIVPFCTMDWRTGEKKSIFNFVYLFKTLASLQKVVDDIIVYSNENISFLNSILSNVHFDTIKITWEKEFDNLVIPIGKYALMKKDWIGYNFVFFTESDQLIYCNKIVLPEYNQYISPHRFEKKFKNYNRPYNQPLIYFDEKQYIVYNEFPEEIDHYSDIFFRSKSFRSSYGGAWIASSDFLKIIDFSKYIGMPLHVPCFSLFENGIALKTKNKFSFFVDHLSGFDNSLAQCGFSIKDFPGKW